MRKITCPLHEASTRWPDQPALIENDAVITYREYNQRVDAVVQSLQREGIGERDLVGILADNCLSYPVLLFALWRLGALACPVSTRLPTEAVAQVLDAIGCNLLVAASDRTSDEYPVSVRRFDMDRLTASDAPATYDDQRSMIAVLDRAASAIFTSGTTDRPKAVVHSFGNHYYSALGSNDNIRVLPGDRWLLSLPLYHVGGLAILFRVMLGGGTVVVGSGSDTLSKTIERGQITHVSLVTTQLNRLLQDGLSPTAAEWLKAILIGGGPVGSDIVDAALERGWPIFTTYGLSEMASQVTTSRPNDSPERLATSGRLLPHRQLCTAADGEILVRGETLFTRYLGAGETEQPLNSDGWFYTGDLGVLDPDGYLTVNGRKDNMFISGGENIHPEEIESCLNAITEIEESVVVGLVDEQFGYRPVAFVRFTPGESLDRETILTSLKQRLPGFKIPMRLFRWPQIDDTESIKPNRSRFRKLVQESDVTEIS